MSAAPFNPPLDLPLWADVLASTLLVAGAAFALLGSWALARWQDFYKRLHGPSKAATLGVGCMLLASMLCAALQGTGSGHELWIALFLAVTTPVSAHLLVLAALKLDPPPQALHPPQPQPLPPPPGAAHAAETESPPPTAPAGAAAPG
jgi:multicomponent K+:H+ antiporter subunit G